MNKNQLNPITCCSAKDNILLCFRDEWKISFFY